MTQEQVLKDYKKQVQAWEPSWTERRNSADVDYRIRVELANSSQTSSIAEAERIRQDSYQNISQKREEKIKKLTESANKRLEAIAKSNNEVYDATPLIRLSNQLLREPENM